MMAGGLIATIVRATEIAAPVPVAVTAQSIPKSAHSDALLTDGRPPRQDVTAPEPPMSVLTGRRGHARIAVLTVIPEEMDAVRRAFGADNRIDGSGYYFDKLDSSGNYQVVVGRCAHRTNSQAAKAVRDLIEYFRPAVIMLVGIAGGLEGRGVAIGDVVVADYVDYMEFVKIDEKGVHLRHLPLDQPAVDLRTEIAEPIVDAADWPKAIGVQRPGHGVPKALVGMIVAGEKILSDYRNKVQGELLRPFQKAIAVDMESKGVAEAMCVARTSVWYNPRYLVIRGISDMVEEISELVADAPAKIGDGATRKAVSEGGGDNATSTPGSGIAASAKTNAQQRDEWKEYAASAAAALAASIASDLLERVYVY